MPDLNDVLFRSLADPTRRAIFERLCRDGEQTVGALTAQAGISQPAVSKHLGVLKHSGLVRDRRHGNRVPGFSDFPADGSRLASPPSSWISVRYGGQNCSS